MNFLYIKKIKTENYFNLINLEIAATFSTEVDKDVVNLEESFTYIINTSFNGIDGPINSATIEDFIPDYMDFSLSPIVTPLKTIKKEIVTTPSNGTKIIFDFGQITNLGVSIALSLRCNFKLGSNNNTIFINTITLNINNNPPIQKSTTPVTLKLIPDFQLTKEIFVPKNIGPKANGFLIYILTLKNKLKKDNKGIGDLGAKITNLKIKDTLPFGFTFLDSNHDPIGTDTSGLDNRYNDNMGIINNNVITFNLPEYYGTEYKFTYLTLIPESFKKGDVINNNIVWSCDQYKSNDPIITSTTIESNTYKAYLNIEGPKHATKGNKISFNINIKNIGNVTLENLEIINIIPEEIFPNRITTGDFCINLPKKLYITESFNIYYEINNNGNYIKLGKYQGNQSEIINLPNLAPNEKITKFKWTLSNLLVGFGTCTSLTIDGIILNNISSQTLNTEVKLLANNIDVSTTQITKLDGLSELRFFNKEIISNVNIPSGETIRYKLIVFAEKSQINNPVITDLLSEQVEYIGNELYSYFNYFSGENITSNNTNFFTKLPQILIKIIPNFKEKETLIRYSFSKNFSLEQKSRFSIEFDVKVKHWSQGTVKNTAVLGTYGGNSIITRKDLLPGTKIYLNVDNRDGDGITDKMLLQSNEVENKILNTISLLALKEIKGPLDTNFTKEPNLSNTFPGGIIEYKLTIKNNGNIALDTLELIDILPYIGDADILNNNISRNSEFKIYIISQIKFKFSTSFSEEIKNFKIEYSKSTDPTHFNSEGKEIGKVNDWSTNLPTPITDIRSFKITIKEKIFPQQKLILSLNCVIPLAIPLDKVAWNSYVLKVNYINPYDNTTIKNLLPVETQKAGVKVKSIAINKLSIGNFVWHDLNGNGIRESGEPGVNGVEVNLYNHCNNTSIATTITNNDFTEKSGYYLFDNLDSDNYCVGFILPNDYVITKQILNNPLGSKVNPLTKRTEIINLASSNFSINMGIYKYVIIEGFIWDDLNVDGIIDSNELGINNITVNLYDSKNLLKIIKSTVTNSMGKYSFNDIAPSKYKIKFIKPVGYEFTLKDIGTDKTKNSKVNEITGFTDEIELNSNEKSINENAGMIKLAKIEGMVWLDKNEDGVKDNIESGIKNIKVTLYNCDDNSETSYTTTTNRAGKYNIKNVFPGKYYALFSNTNGYKFVTTKNLVNMDGKSQCFTLLSGSVKSNLHAPLIDIKNIIVNKEVNLSKAQIGDELVYTITIENKGVTSIVDLKLIDKIPNGTKFLSNSITIKGLKVSDTDLEKGLKLDTILANEIVAISFKVKINDDFAIPMEIENKAKIIFENEEIETVSIITKVEKSSIGDLVWDDLNGNGIQDMNEPGISGVRINLYLASNLNTPLKTTLTDKNGHYIFDNLKSNIYIISFNKPTGYTFTQKNIDIDITKNSKVDEITEKTNNIVLDRNEQNFNIDAGFIKLCSITGNVWIDTNKDGVKQPNENGINNINIMLFDCNKNTKTQYSSTTNSTGDFIINNISPGTYYAIFTKPMGYIFVTTIGLVDDLGKTSCFTLTPGEVKINLNAPLIDLKNISLEKSVNLTKAQIGDELTYTIKIANKGILPVENLKLIDKIPKGTQFIKSSITLEGISIANVDLEAGLNITTIGINETLMITFKVKIIENSLLPWQIKNIAKIIYNGNIKETPPVVTTIEKSSIGNLVWKDLNSNGIQNNHESGISGVLVNLYLSNNPIVPIKSLLTNSNGEYLFDNLRSDNYIVEVIAPEGYAFTIKNAGDDSNINSKVNIDTGRTNIITLTENEQKLNIDAGLIPLSSLEGVVWLDINENGIQDNNEPGIKDIEVTLYYCSNNIKTNYMATTDNNGNYHIINIVPNNYYVKFTRPIGYKFITTKNLVNINGESFCFSLIPEQIKKEVNAPLLDIKNISVDKSVNLTKAEIGDELLYKITIVNNGLISINNIKIIDKVPNGTTFVQNSIAISGVPIDNLDLDKGLNVSIINAGETVIASFKVKINETFPIPIQIENKASIIYNNIIQETQSTITTIEKSSLGNFLWEDLNGNGIQDEDEPGINGINVNLYSSDNLITPLKTTLTHMNGMYLFDNLKSGTYIIEFIKPFDYIFTSKNSGSDSTRNSKINPSTGNTDTITLKVNEQNLNIDGGIIKLATITGNVWLDKNEDGIKQLDEMGISGIKITLHYCFNNIETQYSAITDINGNYIINNILPNKYYAKFSLLQGYKFISNTSLIDDNGHSPCFTLISSQINGDINAPLIDIKDISIEKSVDLSIAQIGDELNYTITIINNGINHIRNVNLIDEIPSGTSFINNSLKLNRQSISDIDLNVGLNIGNIPSIQTVIITFKVRISNTISNTNLIQNKARITFDGGEKETPTVITTVVNSSIGGFVWNDLNGNGIRSLNESGIENIPITLYHSNNLNTPLKTTTTNNVGEYLFDNLTNGEYTVEFGKLIGYTFTKKNIGIDETKNSKVNENTGKTDNITLKQNFQNLNINAGLIKLATLGGTVWLDRNNNGIQEIGELGIKDIAVILYYCNDIIKSLYTSITDSNGKYIIENILPGNYYAKFIEPIGYKFVTTGNLVNSTGKSNCLTLTVGEERLNIDAPLIDIKSLLVEKSVNLTQAEIGDELTYTIKIFNNGVKTVQNLKLSDKIPNGTTLVNNSFTLKNEIIPNVDLSNDLNIGNIQAKETIIITFKVKIEDTIPIPNPIQNKAIIKFEDGEEETLPVITTVVKSSLGDFVWHDLNGNGIQDLNEQGIENINIILYDSNELNIPLKTTTTNENGFYLFDDLRAGEYTIEFIKPIGYTFTQKNAGSNNTKNSKANISTGKTDNIILEKNIQNLNIDAALIKLAKIGGTVWLDKNKNGRKDIDELGLIGIQVTLYYCNDNTQTSYTTITDVNGNYIIENIFPNNYYAKFTKPSGYIFITINNLVNSNGESTCFNLITTQEKLDIHAPLIDIKDISIEKSVDLSIAQIEDDLTYTISITNKGIESIENLKLIDKIPNGTIFINNSLTLRNQILKNIDLSTGLNINNIEKDETIIVKFKVKIINFLPIPTEIKNKAILTYNETTDETPLITTIIEKSSIGNLVWHDLNSNGIYDEGEPGIANITVNLYLASNLNTLVKTITTNENGEYLFDNLKSGEYIVEVIKPTGYIFTKKCIGNNLWKNSKVNLITGKTNLITLERNEDNLNIDAGLVKLSSIEGVTWLDENENGIKDIGESGISEVKVTLYCCNDNTKTIYTTMTDINGNYIIKNIIPNKYYAIFIKPKGYNFITKNNFVDTFGKSNCFTLISGKINKNINAPLISIKELFIEKNVDLIRAEIGDELTYTITITNKSLVSIKNVLLIDEIPNETIFITNSLTLRKQILQNIDLSKGLNIENIESNESVIITFKVKIIDSFKTPIFTQNKAKIIYNGKAEESITTKTFIDKSSLGGLVWNDLNKNGIYDKNEPPISNIIVNLFNNSSIFPIKTTLTDSDGMYLFKNLKADKYIVEFIKPSKYKFTIKDAVSTKNKTSKVNESTSKTDIIILEKSQENLNINAGIIMFSSISGFVWNDSNENGIKDKEEKGLTGVKITLYNCNNNTQTNYSSISDLNGEYHIKNLLPGNYYAIFSSISYYKFITTRNNINENGVTPCFNINAGENIYINAPYKKLKFISHIYGKVINVCNCKGILNLKVFLIKDNKQIGNCLTNNMGTYSFTIIEPGTYTVVVSYRKDIIYLTERILKIKIKCTKTIYLPCIQAIFLKYHCKYCTNKF